MKRSLQLAALYSAPASYLPQPFVSLYDYIPFLLCALEIVATRIQAALEQLLKLLAPRGVREDT
jgi:hypothetical protein